MGETRVTLIINLPRVELVNGSPAPQPQSSSSASDQDFPAVPALPKPAPLRLVETAFLASTAAMIWLLTFTPLSPFARLFFPIPVSLGVLRWDPRTGLMTLVVATLLLTILVGPTRSIFYAIPYGWVGYACGRLWHRQESWYKSIGLGGVICTFGLIIQFLLSSLLVGENIWTYVTLQLTNLTNWFLDFSLGWLGIYWVATPLIIQIAVIVVIIFNSLLYVFTVHLVSALVMEQLRCPLPPPPAWIQFLLE